MQLKKSLTATLAIVLTAVVVIYGMTSLFAVGVRAEENVMRSGNIRVVQHELQRTAQDKQANTRPDFKKDSLLADFDEFRQGQSIYPVFDGENSNAYEKNSYGLWNTSGAIDKFVVVENTGSLSCHFRTWIALECPEGMSFGTEPDGVSLVMNINERDFYWETPGYTVIDGQRYYVAVAKSKSALGGGALSTPSLLQVAMTDMATTEDMNKIGATYDILSFTQAVQTANNKSADTLLDEAFSPIPKKLSENNYHPWLDADFGQFAWDFDSLQRVLKNKNEKHTATLVSNVVLDGSLLDSNVNVSFDATIDLNGHDLSARGGEGINASRFTLTFIGEGKVDLLLEDIKANTLVIKGGTWRFDPSVYLPDGYVATQDGGVFVVSEKMASEN